jgi:4-hydroxy-4-methyl-2-oxoglutarate aldolase
MSASTTSIWDNLGFRAFTRIRRPEPGVVRELLKFSTCDLSDVMLKAQTMIGIHPVYQPVQRSAGPAVTVSVPSGGLNAIKYAAQLLERGDVLVVNAQGETSYALWGGNVSRGLQARGAAAFVIDGAARDVAEIRDLQFPVYARGVATAFREAATPRGEINIPIACGGIVVNPGDIIVCDEEGVVAIPQAAAAAVIQKARALVDRLQSIQPVLLRGEVTMIAQIQEELRAAGLVEHDGTYDGV